MPAYHWLINVWYGELASGCVVLWSWCWGGVHMYRTCPQWDGSSSSSCEYCCLDVLDNSVLQCVHLWIFSAVASPSFRAQLIIPLISVHTNKLTKYRPLPIGLDAFPLFQHISCLGYQCVEVFACQPGCISYSECILGLFQQLIGLVSMSHTVAMFMVRVGNHISAHVVDMSLCVQVCAYPSVLLHVCMHVYLMPACLPVASLCWRINLQLFLVHPCHCHKTKPFVISAILYILLVQPWLVLKYIPGCYYCVW